MITHGPLTQFSLRHVTTHFPSVIVSVIVVFGVVAKSLQNKSSRWVDMSSLSLHSRGNSYLKLGLTSRNNDEARWFRYEGSFVIRVITSTLLGVLVNCAEITREHSVVVDLLCV